MPRKAAASLAVIPRVPGRGRPLLERVNELLPKADAPKVVALPGRGPASTG